jgi:hypothetical protein
MNLNGKKSYKSRDSRCTCYYCRPTNKKEEYFERLAVEEVRNAETIAYDDMADRYITDSLLVYHYGNTIAKST